MSIVLEHLAKSYGPTRVIDDISLDVASSEFFVLLGPSGSGKSTLLRIIAGLEPHEQGRVVLHGRDVTRLTPQQRDIGFVFQHYALFQHMTVAENIEFGLRVRGVSATARRQRGAELLDLVGLPGLDRRMPRQLSGGQQQRVALARALAPRPAVLLLDEPFGALDAQVRSEMRLNLQRIQQELHIATIFVTHDQEEAFQLGDRLGVMRGGQLLDVGTPEDLYTQPNNRFSATFLGTANVLTGGWDGRAIQLGDGTFALPDGSASPSATVQVVIRPEDVALTPAEMQAAPDRLGWGVVIAHRFAGSLERLQLRWTGHESAVVDVVRTQDEARRFPLGVGDGAWMQLRRLHVLPDQTHPLAPATGLAASPLEA